MPGNPPEPAALNQLLFGMQRACALRRAGHGALPMRWGARHRARRASHRPEAKLNTTVSCEREAGNKVPSTQATAATACAARSPWPRAGTGLRRRASSWRRWQAGPESGRRWGAGGSALCSGVLEIRVLLQVLPSTRRRARHGGGPGGSQGASRGRNASARDVISKIYLSIQGAWQHLRAGPGPGARERVGGWETAHIVGGFPWWNSEPSRTVGSLCWWEPEISPAPFMRGANIPSPSIGPSRQPPYLAPLITSRPAVFEYRGGGAGGHVPGGEVR